MLLQRDLLLFTLLIWVVDSKQTASFYGESYIQVPFQDASSSTDLELQFKSQLSYGLLFLAAGSTDYIVVSLKSGLVEVRLDLGSGEAVLHSQPGVRLDDLQWHTVKLTRENGDVELTVDDISTSRTRTKGKFFELNIQYGLFIGGMGNFVEAFYGPIRNYRGCVGNVLFNKYDILHAAKQLQDPLKIFEIYWDCDSVFDSTTDQAVSFLEDTSFLAFPGMHIRKTGTFSCDFKTRSESAIIVYNPGAPPSEDYIALEIVKGKLKVSLDKGNGPVQMTSDMSVNDGLWHQIDLYVTLSSLELSLDGTKKVQRYKLGDSKYINLGDHLYLGGVGFKVRSNAVRQGLSTLKGQRARSGSMKGCIRNVVVNSRAFGFRDIQVSRGIESDCAWEFACAKDPCIEQAKCTEIGKEHFRCSCDEDVCTKPPVTTAAIDFPPEKILLIQSVRGMEGAETQITTNHIEVAFEYNELRIRESAIVFHVLIPPKHGRLEVLATRRNTAFTFSLLDLLENKVSYLHDGTDTEADDLTIEMEIVGRYSNLPSQLKEKYVFLLPIIVEPRNDPPKLKLPPDDTLKIARNSRLLITKTLLNADDPDTKPDQLLYSVMYQDKDNGFFEKATALGKSITTFSQEDINKGIISFLHKGDTTSYLRLQVTDGATNGDNSDLKISASSLSLRLALNTGLVLAHGTSQLILKDNLTTVSNVPAQGLNVKYIINQETEFGEVQLYDVLSNKWAKVTSFYQKDINNAHVRYIHLDIDTLPPSDEFQFIGTAFESRTVESSFKISFVRVQVEVDLSSTLRLDQVTEKVLSESDFRIITNANSLKAADISITVNKPPTIGKLFRKLDPSPNSPKQELKRGDVFNQEEILTGMILYKLNKVTFEKVEDSLDITVSALGAEEAVFTLKVKYLPEETDTRFINNGLQNVPEGGQETIGREDLWAENKNSPQFQFVVLKPVKHGSLLLVDPRTQVVKETNVTEFTNTNILNGELVYKHDDSEHDKDTFTFITSPILTQPVSEETEITELTGTFDISITMRNDNPPRRAFEKIFQVVTNKERVISIDDLAFIDPDIEYDSAKLLYKRQKIRNGEIVHTRNGSVLQQFTQQDILDGNVLFRHTGKAHARSPIWVTDGQYYTSELFEIVAMDAFLIIINNTGIHLNQGHESAITSFNLSVDTNVNVASKDIRFVVSEGPSSGQLLVDNNPVKVFSLDDVQKSRLKYKHDGSRNLSDKFEFSISLPGTNLKGTVSISVLLESQLHPPKVVHNKLLSVEEGTSGTIEEDMLHVSHPDTNPENMEFTVVSPPTHGRLKVIGSPDTIPVVFTQEDITNKKVRYYQTAPGKTSDKFLFDVSNSFHTLESLEFFIDIIPKDIPVQVKNLSVVEGGRVVVSRQHLHQKGKHFKNTEILYHISKQPENGFLQLLGNQRSVLSEFTSKQVEKNTVFYVHDGNETLHDEFTVVAKSTNNLRTDGVKRSQPTTIYISIRPVNDQPPRVVVNRGLQIWNGAMKLITPDILLAVDPDSQPVEIQFQVTNPSNGHVAHVNNSFKEIFTFNQHLINTNQIAFVHSGGEEGSFYLQASDGLNKDIRRLFTVVASPLLLSMKTNQPLEVYPKTIQPITQQNLQAITNDPNQTKPILYNFDIKPRYGRIVTVVSGRPLPVTSFSQSDIDDGRLHYQHTGYMRGWSQRDYLVLEITTLYAEPLRRQRFDISIAYTNVNSENQNQLIHVDELSVTEGRSATLTRENLDVTRFTRQLESVGKRVSIDFIVKSLPKHGLLTISKREVMINSKFTQTDINNQNLEYKHDDSDTESDNFQLKIEIVSRNQAGTGTDTSYLNTQFNITVLPVNDQAFRLITNNPSLQVVQGFKINITREHLLTVDKDTKDSELVYTIINPPQNGMVAFRSHPNVQIQEFTQEDINNNAVLFVSDGSKYPGAFYFKVTDGAARPYFKNFDIRVIPLKVEIQRMVPVKIVQSESSVYLSSSNLDVKTNGHRDDVAYSLKRQPEFGKLYIGDEEVNDFTQTDLDNKLLLYIQTDMSAGKDRFAFNVAIGDTVLVNQIMNITVIPLISQNPFQAPAGNQVSITTFSLDASRLATISGDNPRFDIVKRPRAGKIAVSSRAKRDLTEKPVLREVSGFTHEDIVYGKIFYVAYPTHSTTDSNDSFIYQLSAYNVQPAEGVFEITLKPSGKKWSDFPKVIPLGAEKGGTSDAPDRDWGKSGNGTGPNVHPTQGIVSPSISTDHLLIIIFVCLIVLVIAVVLAVFFLWKRRKEKKKANRAKQRPKPRPFISDPLPLNQPNVHIEPSQHHSSPASDDEQTISYENTMIPSINISGESDFENGRPRSPPPRSPDLSRTEISATVPSCKVTPLLENDGSKSPESTLLSNTSAEVDWTLMDPDLLQHCRTTNPVLRKNKYWV